MKQIQENEIPKYLKRKESNISKAKKKSKHKHQYKECLIQYKFDFTDEECINTSLNSYCNICGKIGNKLKNSIVTDYERKEIINDKTFYSFIPDEELYERYHNKLPVFFVVDYWKDDYVDIEQQYELCESYNKKEY